MRSLLASAALLLTSLLVSLVAAEIVVRIVRPQAQLVISPGGLYVADPPVRYRLAPGYEGRIYNRAEFSNAVRINRVGLRGPELESERDDTVRVLAIGDSFPFGVGVEGSEAFVAVLADLLTDDFRPAVGLNAGVPGFGIQDAQSWLARHGVKLDPDVVVMAIFVGNDLADASPDREGVNIVDGLLVPKESKGGFRAWLHRHSHLYVLLKGMLDSPAFRPWRAKLGLCEPWVVRTLREEFAVYRRQPDAAFTAARNVADRALEEFARLAKDSGFEPLALLIPGDIQVEEERWLASLANLGLDPAEYDPEVPTRVFAELLRKHSIPSVDLTAPIRTRIEQGERLYFEHDRHWLPAGHRLAAEELIHSLSETDRPSP